MNALFSGKRVLVTAGSDGIGRVTAESFLKAGARVHVCSRNGEKLKRCASELPGLTFTAADVSKYEDVERVFADIEEKLGGLDILVNNAGITQPRKTVDITDSDYDAVLDVSLRGTMHMSQAVIPVMQKQKSGSIVCIS